MQRFGVINLAWDPSSEGYLTSQDLSVAPEKGAEMVGYEG